MKHFLEDFWFEIRYHTLSMSNDLVWIVGGVIMAGFMAWEALQWLDF